MYGLKQKIINDLKTIFSEFDNIEKVILYGSRAKGNYKNGSDIDLTFYGNDLNLKTIYAIEDKIEELNLIYTFDLSIFNQIDNQNLIEHINRVGKVFYQKES